MPIKCAKSWEDFHKKSEAKELVQNQLEMISFEVEGPCQFTAKAINEHTTQFEVLNQDLVIANLTEKVNLKIDSQFGSVPLLWHDC